MNLAELQRVISEKWPGRQEEVAKLFSIIGCKEQNFSDFFVFGHTSTGKTSVLRECLQLLKRRNAYVLCTETLKLKQLLCSIYTQLHGYKRKNAESYAGLNVENMVDFFKELPDACKPDQERSIIILDDAHWLSRSSHLRALLQARERSGGANVSFILVSQQAWGSGEWEDLPRMPTLLFPNYKPEMMATCLMKMRSGVWLPEGMSRAVHATYCDTVVAHFKDTTMDLLDFATLASHLWTFYIEPLQCGRIVASSQTDEQLRRKLWTVHFKEQIQAVRRVFEPGMRCILSTSATSGSRALDCRPAARMHNLELPDMTKYLVMASYIASHNKATMDRQIFDTKTRTGRIRSRNVALESDRQVEAAKEAKLKGPHSFPLQRLLTCLSFLQSSKQVAELEFVHGGPNSMGRMHGTGANDREGEHDRYPRCEEGGEEEGTDLHSASQAIDGLQRTAPWWRRRKDELNACSRAKDICSVGAGSICESSDVLSNLAALSSMHLISKAASDMTDPLDGPKYTCHVSEDYATAIADSLGLTLLDYIRYA
ncbi:hypothetical protein CEUSTIGMA_g7509.t1 [Chlamydomonas eustigma]|uniref:Uncharacterized protein n=1 Tax=Chlamydomonas eustigma TaxID=1157962 RepID=A0A250XAF3_9CHLO|nr:hypothetical protein CEUSTIGMA_g7509.t1 [Chlamydomonas eustigma]|eukprot:GAX80071.1 hypothetical protein CEUSTIGMA_g7509.t1 [Chlamydomonas eustigma]